MNLNVMQVSSLEKIFSCGKITTKSISKKTLLKGESFSYQIAIHSSENTDIKIEVVSPIKDSIKLYIVKNAVADFATYPNDDTDYITKEPCLVPDILMPLNIDNATIKVANETVCLWVNVTVPEDTDAGKYPVNVCVSNQETEIKEIMTVKVINAVIPKQKTLFTQSVMSLAKFYANRVG